MLSKPLKEKLQNVLLRKIGNISTFHIFLAKKSKKFATFTKIVTSTKQSNKKLAHL